jgi:hypothetical protein
MVTVTGLAKQKITRWFKAERKRAGVAQSNDRLPQSAVNVLRQWYGDHADKPYPSPEEIAEMVTDTSLSKQQITRLFKAERKRAGVARSSDRLPQWAVNVVKHWYGDHTDEPYLSLEEIDNMMEGTGLTEQQVAGWLGAKRRCQKKTDGGTIFTSEMKG